MAQNVFMTSMYFFIPLKKLTGRYPQLFKETANEVRPDSRIRNVKAKIKYCAIEDNTHEFVYDYSTESDTFHRHVTLKVFIIHFESLLNPRGRYYLAVGTGIDKIFANETSNKTYCTKDDLIHLKKAFYERGDAGLYWHSGGETLYLYAWLDKQIRTISGEEANGRYGRHYVINIDGVDICNGSYTDFGKIFYDGTFQHYSEVIDDADRLAYALIYGNDNYQVVPDETIKKTLEGAFTNNKVEQMFAGSKTIVFLKTHHEKPLYKEKQEVCINAPLDIDIGKALNVYDILLVMEAKQRLRNIQRLVGSEHPADIKEALAAISAYMQINPFDLDEIRPRMEYLYQALGVTTMFHQVVNQGKLKSDAASIRMSDILNRKMLGLTVLMAILGGVQIIVSILCCNNSKTITDMCNCISESTGCMGSCCAVVDVLLGLALAASIIVMAIYQVKSYYRLKDIEKEVKELK